MENSDPFDLNRFVTAQETSFAQALAELKRGRKTTHWMWFIFPQIDGLGSSSTAKFYAIKSLDEAKAYLAHPVLGQRLIECCETLLRINGKSAAEIMGYPDDLKLRSSMTLFASAADDPELFNKVLEKFFAGKPDAATLGLL
jgi:uncharacterized protein (DUF1810 family)